MQVILFAKVSQYNVNSILALHIRLNYAYKMHFIKQSWKIDGQQFCWCVL